MPNIRYGHRLLLFTHFLILVNAYFCMHFLHPKQKKVYRPNVALSQKTRVHCGAVEPIGQVRLDCARLFEETLCTLVRNSEHTQGFRSRKVQQNTLCDLVASKVEVEVCTGLVSFCWTYLFILT